MTESPNLDAELARAVRRTGYLRQGFYLVVLGTALAGQVSGAVEALGIPLVAAVPAVGSLELGGVVVLANADVRRRLGEHAMASRVLSVAIATGAVAFNWLAHSNHLLGGFFAGMSALGYCVWLMHSENARRDRLRGKGDLPPTSPAYGLVQWLRHPWLTRRARTLAKIDQNLGLYPSLDAARVTVRTERRQAAISRVLRRKIAASADPTTAEIAVTVFDLDEVARRLARGADYDGLTALIAMDLNPTRLLADQAPTDGLDVPAFLAEGRPAPAEVAAPTPHLPVAYFPWLGDRNNATIIGTAKPAEVAPAPTATSAPQVAPKQTTTSRRKPTATKRGRKAPTPSRRSAEETRELAAQLRTQQPDITKTEVARLLGISTARLREVEKTVNGSKPTT